MRSKIRPGDKHTPPGDYFFWDPMIGIRLRLRNLGKLFKRK